MEKVFEVPAQEVKTKKPRKPRKPMSPEQKKAFVERMRASRKKKMEEKIRKEMELKQDTSNKVVKEVVDSKDNIPAKVVNNSQVKNETRQPSYDMEHFNSLTNNIKLLNETLTNLSRQSQRVSQRPQQTPKPQENKQTPIKVIDDEPSKKVEPQHKLVEEKKPEVPQPKPDKKRVYNCRRKCYVYM